MSFRSHLAARLETVRNDDGGWGYCEGNSSRLEPTCWGLLALAAWRESGGLPPPSSAVPSLLEAWQRSDGLLADTDGPSNLAFDGLAALCLSALLSPRERATNRCLERLQRGLVGLQGRASPPSRFQRQKNRLRGWPWTEGTSSWVEPTAWCLLALKRLVNAKHHPFVLSRILEGEALLLDRRCQDGGWNYGNSNALGQELRGYVPTTASALLALQDRRERTPVSEGLTFLQRAWPGEQAGQALSLTLMCLSVFGLPGSSVAAALERRYEATEFIGNLCTVGMACYALLSAQRGSSAFTV